MKARELLIEAKNIISTASDRIESRALSQSTRLKPEIISMVTRVRDLLNHISRILDMFIEKTGEDIENNTVINIGKHFYIAFYEKEFVIIRSKPYYTSLSYDKEQGRIYIKTRKMIAYFDETTLAATYYMVGASIKIDDVDEYISNYYELRYVLRELGRVIEQYLYPLVEKRLSNIKHLK